MHFLLTCMCPYAYNGRLCCIILPRSDHSTIIEQIFFLCVVVCVLELLVSSCGGSKERQTEPREVSTHGIQCSQEGDLDHS